jgi:uncharacterized membrane protein
MKKTDGHLIALSFEDMYTADEARAALLRMQGEKLLDIEESSVLVRISGDSYRVSQDTNIVANRQHVGHVLGLVTAAVTGTLPFIMAGTLAGRMVGKITDTGVTNDFINEIKSAMSPGTSALLLYVHTSPENRSEIIERMGRFSPRILQSNMPPELQQEIEDALAIASLSTD